MIVPPLFDIAELGSLLTPGRLLAGRYEVVRHLANGGMGQVFEARDLELDRRVAVKTLHPQVASSPLALERFQREIRLARGIEHPNVCRIYDFGTYHSASHGQSQELLFLVMELLEGETLAARLERRGRIPPEEVGPLAEQLARGLGAAHDQGIVHRDLKSRNVFLVPGPDGPRAVITDFGLACRISGKLDSTLTLEGDLLGTPAYMAPEQLEGGPVDTSADLYALGVVIYEMLTGRLPFEGDTPISVAIQHLHNLPLSPRQLVPGLDSRWEWIVLRCLEKRPSRRFASTENLIAALDRREPARPRHRPRRRWLIASALILAFFAWVASSLLRSEEPGAPETAASSASALPEEPPVVGAYSQGLEALAAYDFETARTHFETAAEADPESALAQIRRAEALFAIGERAEAREAARHALSLVGLLSPEEKLLIQGVFHKIHGDDDRALEIYRELFALVPSSLEYGSALAYLLVSTGEPRAALEVLEDLRRLPPPASADPRLDLLEARIAGALSELERQRQAAERAAAQAAERDLPRLEAEARLILADVLLAVESVTASQREAAHARVLFAEAGSETGVASALMAEGWILFRDQRLAEARERFEQALEIYRAHQNDDGTATALHRLAAVDWRERHLESSRERYLEAIEYHQRTGNRWWLMRSTYNLGIVLVDLGELETARGHIEQARDFWREVGNRRGLLDQAQTLLATIGEHPVIGEHPELELARRLLEGRLAASSGDRQEALERLRDLRALSERTGFYEIELESRLSLCTLETEEAASECLSKLETEAAAKDFQLLARRSREAQKAAPRAAGSGG